MTNKRLVCVLVAVTCAVFLAAFATPAQAQQGSLRGRVIDQSGKPVADAEVTLDFVGDYTREYKAKTDSKGEWVKAGLPPGGGTWIITATKGDLSGKIKGVQVMIGQMIRTEDITISAGGGKGGANATDLSAAEVEKRNKRQKELEQMFTDANTSIDAGNFDDAIAKFTAMVAELPKCSACYSRMGDAQMKKAEGATDDEAKKASQAAAEQSYLKSIEIDPSKPEPYNALASLYNGQKKFDDAAKMSAKANELAGTSATGSSPEAVYNQGIIFWNQGKIQEAKAQFAKVIELDPKMAEAHYWYGMALVNEGKLPDAKKPFEEYLKLAPTGQYADTAKAMLAMIK
ncbi:MAG TPA: tetratricopeptide repeat protein [Vicinamibacterales bacterium]|nr:tetratricopeptide repeat protein [Vicinamibacterales bacterium]